MIQSRLAPGAFLVAACALGLSSGVNACTTCSSVNSYGSGVQSNLQKAIQTTNETAINVAAAYAGTTSQLLMTGDQIVSAVNAGSIAITTELQKSAEGQARLLEALKNSLEQIERSAMIAKTNQEIAETYGAENVPSELCNAFARADARVLAEATAERVIEQHKVWQAQERARERRTPRADPAAVTAVSLSAAGFTEAEGQMAMEQASMLTGESSFPVSPDVISTLASRPGGATSQSQQVLAAWLRTSSASNDLAAQVSKRIVPDPGEGEDAVGERISIMGDLWEAVEQGVHADTAIEDGNATKTALLRSVARRSAVSNRIRYEQLEAALVRNRIAAGQLGFMNERAMHELRDYFESEDGGRAVRGGAQ